MARRGAGRDVYNLGEPVKAPIIAPCNSVEYNRWLREQALQLEEMLGFGDSLVKRGLMSEDVQGRAGLEKIVDQLFAFLQSQGMEVERRSGGSRFLNE